MNYYDSDITETDWSEYDPRDKAERCPITGVARSPLQLAGANPDDAMASQSAEGSGRSSRKLKAMFDKFLYQK